MAGDDTGSGPFELKAGDRLADPDGMRALRPSLLPLAVALVLVSGCSKPPRSVTENQCMAGDWETLGYRDGVNGHRSTRLLAHQDACGELGVVPERETYRRGWRLGIAEYCRPDNGFDLGLRGIAYGNVCPDELEARFLDAHADGFAIFAARRACAATETSIDRLERRRGQLEAEIAKAGVAQVDPLLTPSARIDLAARTRRLVEERVEIEHRLPALRAELSRLREELAALEQVPAAPRD